MFNLFHQLNISPLTVSGFSLSAMSLSKIIAELVLDHDERGGGGGGGGGMCCCNTLENTFLADCELSGVGSGLLCWNVESLLL